MTDDKKPVINQGQGLSAKKSTPRRSPEEVERENEALKQQLADRSREEYAIANEGEGRFTLTRNVPTDRHPHGYLVTITSGPRAERFKACLVEGASDESEAVRAVFQYVVKTPPSKHLYRVEREPDLIGSLTL